ncbi:MAG: enoyl-CoA hydratase/isomerase family protein [Candidatus Abyssobacteria bacterium SURF_17]|uniref:Enoyl-CoA hydratase/isomerase family protein n=1 Tax=Candidatus Abyssobacteria bacterium SURF_17 TaxID=2093361 RepID=A0A419EXY7_9BACT|nr:MAG: enoyl-CoA hydratase/isomerase family protein [Candidatus Abyssubacteria bacterium SURF_17]
MTELVKTKRDENVVTLLLNRPEAFNALNHEMMEQLARHVTGIAADDTIRAVVLTGEGKAFCAGGDLKWALSQPEGAPAAFHKLAAQFHLAVSEIHRMRKPVIAAINGVAAGGGFSLALACDFRVMARSVNLRQAYTSAGLCIDGGGTFTLPRIVGVARAMEIVAFDKPISSEQALAWGLVTRVVEDGRAVEEACAMARELAAGAIHSFGWCKALLTDSFNSEFEAHIERERFALSECAAHPGGQEGLRAFAEKRKPKFLP